MHQGVIRESGTDSGGLTVITPVSVWGVRPGSALPTYNLTCRTPRVVHVIHWSALLPCPTQG